MRKLPGRPVRSKNRFLVFGAPLIGDAEIAAAVDCIKSRWLGTGPRAAAFEQEFVNFKGGLGHAVAVNSCTAALHLALLGARLKPGDEVITTALTFCATVNAIIHAGLVPVLADVDPVTMNIDPEDVRRRITKKTKAIVPVHFAGRPCEMDALTSIASQHDLVIIEDCAHAVEALYRGRPVGTFGAFGCFSFYATKNVVTGEGGLILARSKATAARCRALSLHGLSRDAWKRFSQSGYKHYRLIECGFKYNMMDLQAAIGRVQLKAVERNWRRRRQIVNYYLRELSGLPIGLPALAAQDTKHAYHLFPVLIDKRKTGISRDQFLAGMKAQNIGVGVHYEAIPEHPAYQRMFGWRPSRWPNATRIGRETVSIPLSPSLTDDDARDVVIAIKRLLKSGRRL